MPFAGGAGREPCGARGVGVQDQSSPGQGEDEKQQVELTRSSGDLKAFFFLLLQLRQTIHPSLGLSLEEEEEQRRWKKKLREGREREARQALLIHRLQNKVEGL